MEEFMKLYETVYQDLYRVAYYYLGNGADAEDAVQDAVLAAWENFGKLRRKEAFRAWIFQSLANVCKKSLRRRALRGYPSENPLQEGNAEKGTAAEGDLTERLEILELLSGLDEEERMIILLSVFGGYKGEEIAGILKRRHSTVRSRYRRALKKLERKLQQEEESV